MRSSPMLGVFSSTFCRAACFLAGFALLLAGCGGGEGNEPLFPVSGKVSYLGHPVPRGTVSLRAMKAKGNNTDHQPTGSISADGSFKLFTPVGRVGAPAGWYKVVIFATEEDKPSAKASPGLPQTIIPSNYNNAGTTPLEIEVMAENTPQTHEFVLVGKVLGGAGTK